MDMRKGLLILLLGWCMPLVAQEMYQGRVFADRNGNGVFDKGDLPLKAVAVSDGFHVVKTGTDGRFSLPGYDKMRFIYITTPSGYKSEKFYRPAEGTGKAYDFGLVSYRAAAKDGSHRFVQITDSEIFGDQDQSEWIKEQKEYAENEKPAFIMHTGDICYEKGLKAHIGLLNTTNTYCPVYYSVGNHDLVKGKYGEELYESIYGPTYYSFDAGNVHYMVTPMAGGDHWPSYTRAQVARWMQNDLAQVPAGKPVYVFNHDLLTYGNEFIFKGKDGVSVNLNDFHLKAWIYGHWHNNFMRKQGDVYTVSTAAPDKGGIDHSAAVFRVFHVDGKGDFVSEMRYSYANKAISIASVSDSLPFLTADGKIQLSVNAYHSAAPVKEIKYICRADGKKLQAGKAMQQSDWNWGAVIPLKPVKEGQVLTVQAEALLSNGEVITDEKAFVYKSDSRPVVRLGKNWTNLGGDPAHTGVAGTLSPALSPVWMTNVRASVFMSSPLIADGKVFVASVDENLKGEAYIYALEAATGKLLWKYKTRNSIKNTMAIDANRIFAQDAEGYLYAVGIHDGKLNWEKKLPVAGLPVLVDGLVADNGVVYAGAGKGLCALTAAEGKVLWQNTAWSQGEGTTTTGALGNGVLVTGAQWKGLFGTEAATGKKLWQADKDGLRNRGASAAIHGNFMYLISQKSLFILETKTGKIIVRKELPFEVDVTSTPLLTDRMIVFGTSASGLVALDRETLELKWQVNTGDALVYTAPYTRQPAATIETSPVLAGNVIYVGASDGKVYGVNKDSGEIVWQYNAGAPVFGSVAVSGNTLVVADFSGNVCAFAAR